jgi:hypothetical protein
MPRANCNHSARMDEVHIALSGLFGPLASPFQRMHGLVTLSVPLDTSLMRRHTGLV